MQEYLQETTITRAGDLLRVKLLRELLDLGKNIGGNPERLCCYCRVAKETTEHILNCNKVEDLITNKTGNIDMSNKNNLNKIHDCIKDYICSRDSSV